MIDRPPIGLPFIKMEGLGNDFILVDLRRAALPAETAWIDDGNVIQRLCDRHRGVGADGVLVVLDALPESGAVARMRVRNADGSEAQMCGNGLRCVAKYLYETAGAAERTLPMATAAGVLACTLHLDGTQVQSVEVAMGAPRLARRDIPMRGPHRGDEGCLDQPFTAAGRDFRLTAVSMGNPHAVLFLDEGDAADLAGLRALAERYGPVIEHDPLFPERTNVEFVRARDDGSFDVLVWERGCGVTQACGTGACATAVAACLRGRARPGDWLTVRLLGGALAICVEPDYRDVRMRGPACTVFRGTLDAELFS